MNLRIKNFTMLSCISRKAAVIGFSVMALSAFTISAKADLITNGGFESTTSGNGQLGFNTNATDWSVPVPSGSYTFVFAPGTADTSGANGQYGTVQLWGPGDGSNNGLPASSPAGGNYIASDSDFQQGAVSQMIDGLNAGASYTLGFWWAGAQQAGFSGSSTAQWDVSFGSETQDTAVLNTPSEGFTGWQYQTLTFTADATSDLLSFLAVGTPGGVPPFVLLDGVSLDPVPEAAPSLLLLTVLGLLVGIARLRSKKRLRN
jgi:hypothetical protein